MVEKVTVDLTVGFATVLALVGVFSAAFVFGAQLAILHFIVSR